MSTTPATGIITMDLSAVMPTDAHGNPLPEPLFIDLTPFIANGGEPERATVADVGLESPLLYAARLNEIHGEPGVGKTNVAIALAVAALRAGGTVVYLDPEDNPAGFTRRALALGADPVDLTERTRYLHNPGPEEIARAQEWARENPTTIAVVDGLAESMAAEGLNEDKAGEVLQFFRERLRPFAEAGAAVLVADHVTKATDSRGGWARGSGAKLGRYDGVSYQIELATAYSPGHGGSVRLRISKDRNGGIGRRGQVVAEVHFEPDGDKTRVTFHQAEQQGEWTPSAIMDKIVRHLETYREATKRELRSLGKSQYVDKAVALLIEAGTIQHRTVGNRTAFTLADEAK